MRVPFLATAFAVACMLSAKPALAAAPIEGFGPVKLGEPLDQVAALVEDRPNFALGENGLFYRATVGELNYAVNATVNGEGGIERVSVEKLGMVGMTSRDDCKALFTAFARIFQERYGDPTIGAFYANAKELMATLFFAAWESGGRSITVEGQFGFFGPDQGTCNQFVAVYRDGPLDIDDHPSVKAQKSRRGTQDGF